MIAIKPFVFLALAIPTLLSVTACRKSSHTGIGESLSPIQAAVAQAERHEAPQQVEVRGTVEATQVAAVSVRVMAMITAVHVADGQQVQRGQLLLEIDPQASEGQLAQARGALSQARAALALAERNHERFQALAARNAASELEVDMAKMQYEQAKGAVEQAEGAVSAAASIAGDARVVAPFVGRISRKMVEVGDLAAPGRPLMMLESVSGRRLQVFIPESLLQQADLAIGDRIRVQIDARADLGTLEAILSEMSPGADPASHSIQAKLELPVDDLTTGAAGRAWLEIATRSVVAVPAAAVLQQGGLSFVVLRTSDGKAASRVVTVGRELPDGRVEVLSGLSGGESVLVGLAVVPAAGTPVEVRS